MNEETHKLERVRELVRELLPLPPSTAPDDGEAAKQDALSVEIEAELRELLSLPRTAREDFILARLRCDDLRGADLQGINLQAAIIPNTNLQRANLRNANLGRVDLHDSVLQGADLRWANLLCARLQGVDLRGADLRGANLRGANLRGADLRGADLQGADLRDMDLRGADLRGADLQCADLRGADLRGADLQCADLQCADLQGADLEGADLRGADLQCADLRGAIFKDPEAEPEPPVDLEAPAQAVEHEPPAEPGLGEWVTSSQCSTRACGDGPQCVQEDGHVTPHLYKCAGKYCPGKTWAASRAAHPHSCVVGDPRERGFDE